jgi:hypothetical protein
MSSLWKYPYLFQRTTRRMIVHQVTSQQFLLGSAAELMSISVGSPCREPYSNTHQTLQDLVLHAILYAEGCLAFTKNRMFQSVFGTRTLTQKGNRSALGRR